MLSDDQTTPRPWVVETSTWRAKNGYQWASCGIEQDPAVFGDDVHAIAYATHEGQINPADAALIVRAVNAHEDLIAACEAAYTWLGRFGEHAPIVFGGEAELSEQLRAALLKAGKV